MGGEVNADGQPSVLTQKQSGGKKSAAAATNDNREPIGVSAFVFSF
jgi:hypothetical protein